MLENRPRPYRKSSVARFLISYILVLIIPLCILFAGFTCAFSVLKNDIQRSSMMLLEHSSSLADSEVKSMRLLAAQVANNNLLKELAALPKADNKYRLLAGKTLDSVFYLVNCRDISLLDSLYIVLNSPEYVLYQNALYHTETFLSSIQNCGFNEDVWRRLIANNKSPVPSFSSFAGLLYYIYPVKISSSGTNNGVVVCPFSNEGLSNRFDFSNEYGSYICCIFDSSGRLLWKSTKSSEQSDHLQNVCVDNAVFQQQKGCIQSGNYTTVFTQSQETGWKYVMVVPQRHAWKQLYVLKRIIFILILTAATVGFCVSYILSQRYGKPINKLFDTFSDGNTSYTMQNLVKLFDIAASKGKKELFYPPVLESYLLFSIKAGNVSDVTQILSMMQKENCDNRNLNDTANFLLRKKMTDSLQTVTESNSFTAECDKINSCTSQSAFFNEYSRFCFELCRNITEKKNQNKKELVKNIKAYINTQFSNPQLGLTLAAGQFSLSESYISSLFHEQAGITFADYVESVRIEESCRLLKNPGFSIEDIASRVGYYSVQSFRRAFKRVKGVSPKVLRI